MERKPRPVFKGVPIGCLVLDGKSCPFCGGGWPGTKMPGEALIEAAEKGRLHPTKLGCGTLQSQGNFLVNELTPKE